uniref:Integrase catalytic domain-containing protein n=1 Tax=Tanacetum cinerariifolium TaxID=118510 RepID=A0A6L2KQW3_TANCI|nr:hypothetical protein [Tanacetum cinerariifolium]
MKPKKVGSNEILASPKPSKPRSYLRWSPTRRFFDLKGKIIASDESENQYDCSNGDNACTRKNNACASNPPEPTIQRFPNSTSFRGRTVHFGNGHVAAILGFDDLQWGNILITRVYFIEGLGHNLFSVGQFYDLDLEFLRSKDEAPEVIKTFLKRIIVLLQSPVIIIRTDKDTEFKNQILNEYFDSVGISHQASSVRTPQQNGVVEQRNRTLVEAARTMLIFSRAPLFLWAEEIATACYTQNRSIIHHRFNKIPYELINGRTNQISPFYMYLRLFVIPRMIVKILESLVQKVILAFSLVILLIPVLTEFITEGQRKIIETINVTVNELFVMAFEQRSSKPELQSMTSGQISSGLDLTYAPSTITTQKPTERELELLFKAMYDDYIGGQPSAAPRTSPATQAPQVLQTPTVTTTIADTAPTPTNSSSQAINFPNTSHDVDELETQQQYVQHQPATIADNVPNAMSDENTFVNPFATPSTSATESSSS